MKRKSIGMMAIVATAYLALAVLPSLASAGTLYAGGSPVSTGTKVKGTNVGNVRFVLPGSSGETTCSHADIEGTVYLNSSNDARITAEALHMSGTNEGGACGVPFGIAQVTVSAPQCLENNGITESLWNLRGGACNAAVVAQKITFTYQGALTGLVCEYKRTAGAPYRFASSYNTNPLVLTGKSGQSYTRVTENGSCVTGFELLYSLKMQTAAGVNLELR